MDPTTYTRIQRIVERVRTLDPESQAQELERLPEDDRELVASILDLGGREDGAFSDEGLRSRRRELEGVLDKADDESGWHPDFIGSYRVEGVIGRGGTGVVFRAQQAVPARAVAIKLLHPAMSTAETVERLRREAEILGALRHPGIAQIHEAATFDGGFGEQPYLVMELVLGSDVVTYAERNGLGDRERVALVIEVCAAVQHAHDRGVVHRDLKPDNILVDEHGQPKLLDFGIAGVRSGAGPMGLTADAQIIGTVSYMPPEQASRGGRQVGPAADVYAIGAVAFELLVGRPPRSFEGASITEVLRELLEVPAPSASSLRRGISRDLDTILAKALEARPEDRYPSAAALALELQRFLDGRPIAARPPTPVDRAIKFTRRNRGPVAAAAGIIAALAAGMTATSIQAMRAHEAEVRAKLGRYAAEMLTATARLHDPVSGGRSGEIVERWDPGSASGEAVAERIGFPWEWHLLRSVHRTDVERIELPSPPTAVAWTPDGTRLAVAMQETVGVYGAAGGQPLASLELPPEERPSIFFGVSWSPDGARLAASGQGGVLLWRPDREGPEWFVKSPFLPGVGWTPDGGSVVSMQDEILVVDARTGDRRARHGTTFHGLNSFAFLQGGRSILVTAKVRGLVEVDLRTGDVVRDLAHVDSLPTATAASPSGDVVAVADIDGQLSVHEHPSGELRFVRDAHGERVFDVDWRPRGGQIATASEDGTVRTFDARSGQPIEVYHGHTGSVRRVVWSPDGARIASTSWGGELLIWEATERGAIRRLRSPVLGRFEVNGTLSYDAGRRRIWAATGDGGVAWEVDDGRPVATSGRIGEGSVSPDGACFVTESGGDEVIVVHVDASPASERRALLGEDNWLYSCWLAGSRRIVTGNRCGLFLTEVAPEADAPLTLTRLADVDGQVVHVESSRRGDRVAVLGTGGTLRVHGVQGAAADFGETRIPGVEGGDDVAWSHDDRELAVACYDGRARVVAADDLDSWRLVLAGHAGPVTCVHWHPSGDRIATGSRDRTVKLWDAGSGALVGSLELAEGVADVLWVDDGRILAALDRGGQVTLWDISRSRGR